MIRSKSVSLFEESVKLVRVRVMALNATFNNISVISWRLVLLVEETGVSGENYRPVACIKIVLMPIDRNSFFMSSIALLHIYPVYGDPL